jgi:colanic acid biosynthesis glycosyl transferase WcaI
MKILLLTHYYPPENGAPQRRWSALISRLTAAGHEVDVICPPPHYPSGRLARSQRRLHGRGMRVDRSGARVIRVTYLPHDGSIVTRTLDHLWVAAATVARASRLLRSGRLAPDVVIATAPALETLIAGRILARLFSLPLVAEMRDAWPDLVAHTPGLLTGSTPTTLIKRQVHRFVTELQRGADAVVTTTATFADVLRSRSIEDITVLRNATELARYDVIDPAVRSEGDGLRLLYMGTIGRSQGLDRIVEAAARAEAKGIDLEVRIVGQGADVERLRRLTARLSAPVRIFGQVEGSEVPLHYAWADSTIVSLRDWEPFGWTVPSKLYELLATGKHITAVVSGEAADIVRAAGAGDVVSPGDVDALVELWAALTHERDRLRVGPEGRRWVERNADFDHIAEEYVSVLARASQRRRARA